MRKLFVLILIVTAPALLVGQAKKRPSKAKPVSKPAPVATTPAAPQPSPAATPEPTPDTSKKNSRPNAIKADKGPSRDYTPVYVYTFERAGFSYSKIKIEHDEDGRGRIWFTKDGEETPFDDPLEISSGTLAQLKKAFDEMRFLEVADEYQYPGRDFSNMGNLTITVTRGAKSRTAKYNWTENRHAKVLMDTYRGISNEATWKFEMTSARDNQPLLTPGLVDALDSLISRGEIVDPPHLLPYLTPLASDERLPLMARNHLSRLIKQLAKK